MSDLDQPHQSKASASKRIDILPSSREITVMVDGVMIAKSSNNMFLFETSLKPRYYMPKTSVSAQVETCSTESVLTASSCNGSMSQRARQRPDVHTKAWRTTTVLLSTTRRIKMSCGGTSIRLLSPRALPASLASIMRRSMCTLMGYRRRSILLNLYKDMIALTGQR